MKQILFVINTLGRAGAEMAFLELCNQIDTSEYEVDLYVLAEQGELVHQIPKHVHILNQSIDDTPVLSKQGTKRLIGRMVRRCVGNGSMFYRIPYLVKNACILLGRKQFSANKLTRRLLADSAKPLDKHYDMAVAYLEGGASFFVCDKVKADKKVAFLHVDYQLAGYNRSLDQNCFTRFDKIFAVSDEVKESFLQVYPECKAYTDVFHNLLPVEKIRKRSQEAGGFTDDYAGIRIVTVGRLYAQKAFEVSIEAMALLKARGHVVRWYVLGEGDERPRLENLITNLGLQEDFLLLGAVENPYPYMRQCDIYVHASRFEGKSIAVQEAQVLGCPIILSDCRGNREQIAVDYDGLLCQLTPESICENVERLLADATLRERLGNAAAKRKQTGKEELQKLYEVARGTNGETK